MNLTVMNRWVQEHGPTPAEAISLSVWVAVSFPGSGEGLFLTPWEQSMTWGPWVCPGGGTCKSAIEIKGKVPTWDLPGLLILLQIPSQSCKPGWATGTAKAQAGCAHCSPLLSSGAPLVAVLSQRVFSLLQMQASVSRDGLAPSPSLALCVPSNSLASHTASVSQISAVIHGKNSYYL